ncbi:LytR C-terminal domain-containing protein [Nocardioides bizhenqiangii]|uniref:LytR C-terminal domain-containing protein n=1 Tax=Nocardioides bizhenqiangii TaxID=3095076 RepID=A0ABZ0ZUB0_9ACTN|nr:MULTISPECIES: LytR C-terminal domain-containing protein [unclassified Nocardioides]MDZ5621914.1 LytR C-terminal domain-containing protein [Nocardioides sp. HM23]WQQ27404.1 LytR C-terminal domain-containing protein [Nocardioides sp. HM61]
MHGRPSPDQVRHRDQRGAVLPSPVVWLSIIAVVVAAVAFVATRDADPEEREITTSSSNGETSDSPTPTDEEPESDDPTETTTPDEPEKTKPPVVRSEVGVVVFNNTSISGLASETLARVQEIGWNGLAADDWYGTIPATTVYFPPGMRDAAQKLALDLGVQRLMPADAGMSDTNLTVILTGALS